MGGLGFVYDQTRCIGCNACQMACKDEHDLEPGLFFRRVDTIEFTDENGEHVMHYSGACNHCEDPACVKHCPTGAMYIREDGTVGNHTEKCIGCGCCVWACPYGAPIVSHRLGKSLKCDSCYDRRREGKEPACVAACITHCLRFGDLEELTRDDPDRYTASLPFLPSPDLTHPSLRIRQHLHDGSGDQADL